MRQRVISISEVSANPDFDALDDIVEQFAEKGIAIQLRPYIGGVEMIFNEAYYSDVVGAVEQAGFTVVER